MDVAGWVSQPPSIGPLVALKKEMLEGAECAKALWSGVWEKEAPGSVSFRGTGGLRRSGCSSSEVKDGSEGLHLEVVARGSQVWEGSLGAEGAGFRRAGRA